MKKIELKGISGLYIEIYDTKDKFTREEILREADKAMRRELMRSNDSASVPKTNL